MNRSTFAALAVLSFAALTLPAMAADDRLSTPAVAPSAAQRLANAFAAAADAEASGDKARLAKAVQVIDALGSHPLDASVTDPMPTWRANTKGANKAIYRGRPLGPGYRSGTLTAGGHDSFNQLFLSGTGASIALSAPTGDKLALRVLDPQAKPICEDGSGRGGMCKWVPLFTQRYTIEVKNLGKGDARYFLVVQ